MGKGARRNEGEDRNALMMRSAIPSIEAAQRRGPSPLRLGRRRRVDGNPLRRFAPAALRFLRPLLRSALLPLSLPRASPNASLPSDSDSAPAIVVSKTFHSLRADSERTGVPTGWTLSAAGIRPATGAGFGAVHTGDIPTGPGLIRSLVQRPRTTVSPRPLFTNPPYPPWDVRSAPPLPSNNSANALTPRRRSSGTTPPINCWLP